MVKGLIDNISYMDKFYNKKTGRYNTVQSAINNGLFKEPVNFELPKNTVFIKQKRGYAIVPKTPNLKIKNEELFYGNINRSYVYDPITNKLLNKTKKNIKKVIDKEVIIKKNKNENYIKKVVKRLNDDGLYDVRIIKNPYLNLLYKELQKYIGKKISVGYIRNNEIVEYHDYFPIESNPKKFSKFWKNIIYSHYHWMVYSDATVFDEPSDDIDLDEGNWREQFIKWNEKFRGALFIIEQKEIKISEFNFEQFFKDGITNCLLTPIKSWVIDKIEKSDSSATKAKYRKKLKVVDIMMKKYNDGVPENEIINICNALQIDINIDLPFNAHKFINCKSTKKALNAFNFINTKLNHVDNSIVNNNNVIKCSYQELKDIKKDLHENGEFFTYNNNTFGITCINTLNNKYSLANDYLDAVMEFEKDNNIKECKIDDIDDKELSEFVLSGVHYNGTIDFQEIYEDEDEYINEYGECEKCETNNNPKLNWKDYLHIDMKKAYAYSDKCILYEGFLGKITDFRKTDKIEGLGMYQIYDLDFSKCDEKFKLYNDKMDIYRDNYIYPSPELKLLDKYNVSYKIKGGCWGVKPLNLKFGPNMFKKFGDSDKDEKNEKAVELTEEEKKGILKDVAKEKKQSYYGVYAGGCNSIKTHTNYKIKGDEQYAALLKKYANKNTDVLISNNEITVLYPKQHVYHLSQLTAFFTSYVRISVLNQLMSMDFNKIVRVCSDGIYTSEFDCVVYPQFSIKEDGTFGNRPCETYINCIDIYNKEFNDYREHHNKELHLGGGGCGKTHFNLVDKGLIKPLYVAPSWKLAINKKEEYNYKVSVWARLITKDPEQIKYIKDYNNVLIIDEVSMMTEGQKEFILNTYDNMKIIFCGDLGYQIGPIEEDEMTSDGFDYIKEYTINRRFKCEILSQLCEKLRYLIKEVNDKHIINKFVTNYFKKLNKLTESNLINYDIQDMILTGTNIHKEYFTEIYKGKFDKEKYYITSNSQLYQNGCIVIGDKPNAQCKIRHAFTVHSIQGETAKNKLFIDNSKMFDVRMFYTAISRAEYIDQITIIKQSAEMAEHCEKEEVKDRAQKDIIRKAKLEKQKKKEERAKLRDAEEE